MNIEKQKIGLVSPNWIYNWGKISLNIDTYVMERKDV